MRNFYNTKLDLENKKDRIEILEHKIEKANSELFKITSTLKDVVTSGGQREKDKITKLIANIQIWQSELINLKEDVLYLTPYVERMEQRVNNMVGIHKKVFEGFYCTYANEKTGDRIRKLAKELSYSEPRIYQLLNEVNKELGIRKKDYKKL